MLHPLLPMPALVRPQLPTLVDRPPSGEGWLHEIKHDGYRTMARLEAGAARLITRRGLDWTERYGELPAAFARLKARQALIEGELVIQGEDGIDDWNRLHAAAARGERAPYVFFAFDLLWLDGEDLRRAPLLVRKARLANLLGPASDASPIQLSGHLEGDGPTIFEAARPLGVEGLVSKRCDKPYVSDRSPHWLKSKFWDDRQYPVIGFIDENPGVAALALAERTPAGLVYIGRVGTGWSRKDAATLRARLLPLRTGAPAAKVPASLRRKAIWLRPELAAHVVHRGRTGDGQVRHASFRGLVSASGAASPTAAVA